MSRMSPSTCVYKELHPRKGWRPEERKWVYAFEEVNEKRRKSS